MNRVLKKNQQKLDLIPKKGKQLGFTVNSSLA